MNLSYIGILFSCQFVFPWTNRRTGGKAGHANQSRAWTRGKGCGRAERRQDRINTGCVQVNLEKDHPIPRLRYYLSTCHFQDQNSWMPCRLDRDQGSIRSGGSTSCSRDPKATTPPNQRDLLKYQNSERASALIEHQQHRSRAYPLVPSSSTSTLDLAGGKSTGASAPPRICPRHVMHSCPASSARNRRSH